MKVTTGLTAANIVAFNQLISKSRTDQTVTHNNDQLTINTAINSHTLRNDFAEVGYLKSFDTAFIAYQMMGLSE
ncbi:hypothetical protein NIES4103_25190 [Nostoc sp. NIES-4103]|nr:hypothetical protein NIES4103_25190 [Nostoc sp. NIES-4103]